MDGHDDDSAKLSLFLQEYAGAMLAAGAHTERCVRNVSRMAEACGCEVAMTISQKNISMSLADSREPENRYTSVYHLSPVIFNFSRIGLLSALTWRALDDHLPLAELKREYHHIMAKGLRPLWVVTLCIAAANAAFCRLFGGDAAAMALVLVGTALGYDLRVWFTRCRLNHHGIVVICAFLSSAVAALGMRLAWGSTAEVALATSVLYLVPGVQIINTFMDLINGYTLNAYQRGVASLITITCMALGLALAIFVVGVQGFDS